MAPTSTSDTRRLAVVSINYMFMRFCDADTNQSQSLDADKFYAMQSPALKASYSRTNFDMWRSNDKWSVRSSSTAQPPGGSRGLESEATSMWTWATARVASTRPRSRTPRAALSIVDWMERPPGSETAFSRAAQDGAVIETCSKPFYHFSDGARFWQTQR